MESTLVHRGLPPGDLTCAGVEPREGEHDQDQSEGHVGHEGSSIEGTTGHCARSAGALHEIRWFRTQLIHEYGGKVPESTGGALRYDQGKPRVDLIPAGPLLKLAEVFTFGAQKYEPNNWRKGMDFSRMQGSMMRHYLAWAAGEETDEEGGFHHLAAVAWGALCLLELIETHPECDDRYQPTVPNPMKEALSYITVDQKTDYDIDRDELEATKEQTTAIAHNPQMFRGEDGEIYGIVQGTRKVYRLSECQWVPLSIEDSNAKIAEATSWESTPKRGSDNITGKDGRRYYVDPLTKTMWKRITEDEARDVL